MVRLIEELSKVNIRPSYQRVTILKALRSTKIHPTVDELLEIISNISDISISRATLYNTLQLFTEKGIITQVDAASNEARYDATTSFHPHFICERCKRVIDIDGEKPLVNLPKGYHINKLTLNINGICRECSEDNK